MVIDAGAWSGRRVLVTGHTGFKGSWLSLWLQDLGAHVSGIALAPEGAPNLFDAARVAEGMDHRVIDVRDAAAVDGAVAEIGPEVVFHLAAQPLVRRSFAEPVLTYATNVMGTVHVLEAVRRVGTARSVVVVTTDKCYENRERDDAYVETDGLGGHDPYSSSKASAELVAASYRASFFPPDQYAGHRTALATARAGNVIGGGDWSEDRLMPDIIRAFSSRAILTLRNPLAVRPWQHVLDCLSGYLLLAQALLAYGPRDAEPFNFGPDHEDILAVADLGALAADAWSSRGGAATTWAMDLGEHPPEAHVLRLDAGKARARLGWRPRLAIDEAIAWTMDWHLAVTRGEDPRDLVLRQIRAYQDGKAVSQ